MSYLINEDNIYFHVCHRKKGKHESVEECDEGGAERGASSVSEAPEGAGAQVLAKAIEKALLEMTVLCTKKAQVRQRCGAQSEFQDGGHKCRLARLSCVFSLLSLD